MPFGPNCEYADHADCVRRNQDKDDPEAWCAALMRATEEKCAGNCVEAPVTKSLSEKRREAGRKGAAARWGARADAQPAGDGELVFGTAAQLRRMADAVEGGEQAEVGRAKAQAKQRISAFQARHPNAVLAEIVGRPWCESITVPAPDRQGLRVVNQADSAEIWIYDEISWWGVSAQQVVDELADIDAAEIVVHINSPGGDAFDGFAIKQALDDHPADISVRIDSLAASAASVVAMAGDDIAIAELGMVMIHDAMGFTYGNADDMRQMADMLDKVSQMIAGAYTRRAGGSVTEWRDRMRAETWFDAAEAVDVKLADRILGQEEDDDDDDDEEDEEEMPGMPMMRTAASARPAASVNVPRPPAGVDLGAAMEAALIDLATKPVPTTISGGDFHIIVSGVANDAPAPRAIPLPRSQPPAFDTGLLTQALGEGLQ